MLTTTATREEAQRLARTVLERRLAACVQVVGPVESQYWWKGVVERSEEWLCIIKTTRRAYPALERAVTEAHPYEVPEITALPVVEGSTAYLAWIAAEVSGPDRP